MTIKANVGHLAHKGSAWEKEEWSPSLSLPVGYAVLKFCSNIYSYLLEKDAESHKN